jgi:hypothetical protein
MKKLSVTDSVVLGKADRVNKSVSRAIEAWNGKSANHQAT